MCKLGNSTGTLSCGCGKFCWKRVRGSCCLQPRTAQLPGSRVQEIDRNTDPKMPLVSAPVATFQRPGLTKWAQLGRPEPEK